MTFLKNISSLVSAALQTETLVIVMQDLAQMLLLVVGYYIGWHVFTSALQLLHWDAPKRTYKDCPTSITCTDACSKVAGDAADHPFESARTARQHTFDLLESYGAFGASVGSWSSASSQATAKVATDCATATGRPTLATAPQAGGRHRLHVSTEVPTHRKNALGLALLEQYGAFGACAGAWNDATEEELASSLSV